MPAFSDKVYHQLNLDHAQIPDTFQFDAPAGHKINQAQPIFRVIPLEEIERFRAKFAGATGKTDAAAGAGGAAAQGNAPGKKQKKQKQQQKQGKKGGGKKGKAPTGPLDVSRIDMRVGVIKRVWPHPDADRLFCEEVRRRLQCAAHGAPSLTRLCCVPLDVLLYVCPQIDIGEEEPRQIASGLREHYSLEEMEGRKIIVIANLKPRKMVRAPCRALLVSACHVGSYAPLWFRVLRSAASFPTAWCCAHTRSAMAPRSSSSQSLRPTARLVTV